VALAQGGRDFKERLSGYSNLGSAPAGTQSPGSLATVQGTLRAADVIGPADQGIDPGEFGERAGATYANVQTNKYPGGENRAQIERRGRGR